MKVVGKPGVGEVLAGWMNDCGLNPTELARRAQISRATVYVVLDSKSKNPETMRQLARGLAKRGDDDEHGDPDVDRKAARELLSAAGYGSLIVEIPPVGAPAGAGGSTRHDVRDFIREAAGEDVAAELLAAHDEGGLGEEGERSVALFIRTLRENKRLREGR